MFVDSRILVALQFGSAICMLVPSENQQIFAYWWVFCVASILFSLWIFIHNRVGNFNIVPEIKQNAELIRSGPYRWIRHPMYFALLLFFLGILLGYFNLGNLFCFAILITAALLKAIKEEQLWLAHHPEYKHYLSQTKRIIPFIW